MHGNSAEQRWIMLARWSVCVLILGITVRIVARYSSYLPPNFESPFLRGREAEFHGLYRAAFYVHIVSGPICILLGMGLVNRYVRERVPDWHRWFGRIQVMLVLLLLAPSGMIMAPFAESGIWAATGFACLAAATFFSAALGWRCAVVGKFGKHQSWMFRCFLMLNAAIVLRLIGGLTALAQWDADRSYRLAAWASWLVPLAVFEVYRLWQAKTPHFTDNSPRSNESPVSGRL